MTASEMAELRRELLKHLERIVGTVPPPDQSEVAAKNAVERDPDDEAEDAILDELDGIMSELSDHEAHLAEEIVAALDRMRIGEFGRCIDCGQEIPFARLKAVPWTQRCALDQNRFDGNAHPPTL